MATFIEINETDSRGNFIRNAMVNVDAIIRFHAIGPKHWLLLMQGVMYCAEYAYAISENDDQRLMAERLFENVREAQAEAYADAAMDDDD